MGTPRLTLASILLGLSLPAAAAPAECILVVQGKPFIDGLCNVSISSDGSFYVGGPGAQSTYFVSVNMTGNGDAEGYWNEVAGASHTHTPLGTLTRRDACWWNRTATVCAWRPGTRPR